MEYTPLAFSFAISIFTVIIVSQCYIIRYLKELHNRVETNMAKPQRRLTDSPVSDYTGRRDPFK